MKKTSKADSLFTKNNSEILPVIGIERHRIEIDGQGIRTLIGLSGCPLRCKYCLNPQSWDSSQNSSTLLSPMQLYEIVRIDNLYFLATKGGITFGGGEPLLHTSGIAKFKALCPDDWTIWAETSLNVPSANLMQAIRIFDHFIVDIKALDPEIYQKYTSGNFSVMYHNLELLLKQTAPEQISVRVPFIPGYTDKTIQQKAVAKLSAMGIKNIEIFPYNTVMK